MMANGDIIFMQTDPTFLLPLQAIAELRQQNRLQVTASQTAEIQNIRSQAEEEESDKIFGGRHADDPVRSRQYFARAFSTVARMCMTRATNMTIGHTWMDYPARKRNVNNIVYSQTQENLFRLSDNIDQERYTSRYDQFYPHFLTEERLAGVEVGGRCDLNSLMFIVKNDFTKIIQVQTTAHAVCRRDINPGNFHSRIHVLCLVCSVLKGEDGEAMSLLRKFTGDPREVIRENWELNNALENLDIH